jgi:hypothetical protein
MQLVYFLKQQKSNLTYGTDQICIAPSQSKGSILSFYVDLGRPGTRDVPRWYYDLDIYEAKRSSHQSTKTTSQYSMLYYCQTVIFMDQCSLSTKVLNKGYKGDLGGEPELGHRRREIIHWRRSDRPLEIGNSPILNINGIRRLHTVRNMTTGLGLELVD